MLTIAEYKDAQGVIDYFRDHLESGDYHTEKGAVVGLWAGEAAEFFGLEKGGRVQEDDFAALVRGEFPGKLDSFLIRRKKNRVVAREMLFSAPKSVSILAVTLQDQRLAAAHDRAVEKAFGYLEALAQTRVRRGLSVLAKEKRVTGNILAARFRHSTSRALDPQLHTHHVVMNVTYDHKERRLKALDPRLMYDASQYVTEIYRSELAREVMALGYEIEGGRHTWRIKGVSSEIETLFSKRAGQIDRAAKKLEEETGIKVSNKGRAVLAESTRKAKEHELSEEECIEFQQKQLGKHELKALNGLVEASKKRVLDGSAVVPEQSKEAAAAAIDYAFRHVFERQSVVSKFELFQSALKFANGSVAIEDLEEALKDPRFKVSGNDVMTREERLREHGLVATVNAGRKSQDPLLSLKLEAVREAIKALTAEQKKALKALGESTDQFMYLRGAAGAGKTFTLTALANALAGSKNLPPLLLAPSSSATETLRAEGFEDAMTLQRFLGSDDAKTAGANRLWIVDEAGLVSTKQMEALFEAAESSGNRVLLVGDTRQHNSVEGGDALRLIETYSFITKASISKITRQTEHKYLEAVQLLSQGEIPRAWEVLNDLKVINEVKNDKERLERVATEYVESLQAGRKTLVVAPTWDEIRENTKAIREKLKTAGVIGREEKEVQVFRSSNFTEVERSYWLNYESGKHHVSFFRSKGEFKQGEVWKVVGRRETNLLVEHEKHGKKELDAASFAKAFDVLEAEKIGIAKGDRLLVRANYADKNNRVLNGQIIQVSEIKDDGSILTEKGKTLSPDFRQFSYGYAVTSQGSQGKTCDRVLVSMKSKSKAALSKHQFYVSASRGRESIAVFTDNAKELKKSVMKSSCRRLVMDRIVGEMIFKAVRAKTMTPLEVAAEKAKALVFEGQRKLKQRRNRERAREKPKDRARTYED